MLRIWEALPRLTERVWEDHAEAGLLGGHHDPDHAVRVGQMALELATGRTALLAGAAGLLHNADRLLQRRLGIGRREVPPEEVRQLVLDQLQAETRRRPGSPTLRDAVAGTLLATYSQQVVEAVLRHDGRNGEDDSPVLVALMDADRLVNSEPDLIIRSGQLYHDLPPVDPIHLDRDPEATYRDPRSVLRDVMEVLPWLTPGTDFYVRLPKAREIAARRREFFQNFREELVSCRRETGFYPYPRELRALREKYAR